MIKHFVVHHFNAVLALSVLIGLCVPGLEHLPKASAMVLISGAIFFSCSTVTMDEIRGVNIKHAALFYLVRFILLPIPIYYAALYTVPDYAVGVLLVALVPVGASATAVAALTKANPSLALSATIVTNALAPFTMPVLIYVLIQSDIDINLTKLFITLGLSIFMPAFLYFAVVRRFERLKLHIRSDSHFYSTLCIAGMMAAVVALEKDYILSNLWEVAAMIGVGCVLFAALYIAAWGFARNMRSADLKTYMVCSGVNNTGISAGLALLYFSPVTILFVIIAEIPWTIGLMLYSVYARKYHE